MKTVLLATSLLFIGASGVAAAPEGESKNATADVVARVGDESITFNEINTMLNSSAIVGLSIPELGTPERDRVRLTLLDKIISANLIYLDAVKKGVDQDPAYLDDLQRFSDSMLAYLYEKSYLTGDIEVSDEEVKAFFDANIASGTELTEEVKASIASKLRKQKLQVRITSLRERLREGVEVDVHIAELDPDEDAVRDDADVVATLNGEALTWGEVKPTLSRPVNSVTVERRVETFEDIIDNRIMTKKGRDAGLKESPLYRARLDEFKKVRLINLHRTNLAHEMEPTDQEIRDYYAKHRDRIMVRERRKVQIVVLKTREEADALKKMLEAGTLTMYQAAAEHSIIPGAKETLGELGWVSKGTGFPELDELTFSLGPGEIGGPVQTPNGWHLVKVQDMESAVHDDIKDQRTWHMTRRMLMKERLDHYVIGLREKGFAVEVYDERLSYHMQKEVDWYKIKAETGAQPPDKIYQEIDQLRGVP